MLRPSKIIEKLSRKRSVENSDTKPKVKDIKLLSDLKNDLIIMINTIDDYITDRTKEIERK